MTISTIPGGKRRPFRDYRYMRCPHCGKVSEKEDWMIFLSGGGLQVVDMVDPRSLAVPDYLNCPRCEGPLEARMLLDGGYDIFLTDRLGWVAFPLSMLGWLAVPEMDLMGVALLAGIATVSFIALLRLLERAYFRTLRPKPD